MNYQDCSRLSAMLQSKKGLKNNVCSISLGDPSGIFQRHLPKIMNYMVNILSSSRAAAHYATADCATIGSLPKGSPFIKHAASRAERGANLASRTAYVC